MKISVKVFALLLGFLGLGLAFVSTSFGFTWLVFISVVMILVGYFGFIAADMLGVGKTLLLNRESVKRKCGIPFCEAQAFGAVKIGDDAHYLCEKHFRQTSMPLEMKRKTDNDWLNEERKRRMFNPTTSESAIMENLWEKGVLEGCYYGGKASYRPTGKFADLVAKACIDLLLNHGYSPSYYTQMEEGTKIAIRQTVPELKADDAEKYTEIVSPFILFDRMDREMGMSRRDEDEQEEKKQDSEVEEIIPQQWLQNFISKNQPPPKLVQTARDMFFYVKKSAPVSFHTVRMKEIFPLLLEQQSWSELWQHWPSQTVRSDEGIIRQVKEMMDELITKTYGSFLDTSHLRKTGFEYDYLIFLNKSLIETSAKERLARELKSEVKSPELASNPFWQPIFELMMGETLMHEIVHVLERLSKRKIIKSEEGQQDPFVLFAYSNFLGQTKKENGFANFTGTSYNLFSDMQRMASEVARSIRSIEASERPQLQCPIDGLRCPLGRLGTQEERKNCAVHKCPLVA